MNAGLKPRTVCWHELSSGHDLCTGNQGNQVENDYFDMSPCNQMENNYFNMSSFDDSKGFVDHANVLCGEIFTSCPNFLISTKMPIFVTF